MSGSIRLASAPINWGITADFDPDNPTPDELLQSVADAGYTGCEFGPFGYFGSSDEHIGARFDAYGLATVAIWVDIQLSEPLTAEAAETLGAICARLRRLEAQFLIVSDFISDARLSIVSRVADYPELWWSDDDWKQVRQTLIAIGEIAASHGRTVAVHPHVGGHIETGHEIEQLLRAIDGTGIMLCIDTGHIRIGGVDSIPILKREMHRVVHLHAKDVDQTILNQLQQGALSYEEAVGAGLYCDLGTGMIDWAGFRDALKNAAYAGWVVAEQDRLLTKGSRAPFDSNQRNYEFLQTLLQVQGQRSTDAVDLDEQYLAES
ncbi:TIM barrel protein [soil metagenome]